MLSERGDAADIALINADDISFWNTCGGLRTLLERGVGCWFR